jgi:D-alanyl-D-alanine carboxypeptidase
MHHVSRRRLLALTGGAATAAAVSRPAQLLAQHAPATGAFAGTRTLQSAGTPPFAATLEPMLLSAMEERLVPGAIVYVSDPEQGAWTTALGTGNLASREPMQVTNSVRIGSLTKTFTTTVILQLVDQGLLHLDDPVSTYQPAVPNGDHITIRQMLNMTSGLATYDDDDNWVETYLANPYRVWSPEELVAVSFELPPDFPPGEGWHYSNTNTILLGMIVEQLTQQSLEDVFQRTIFDPLGMEQTGFSPITSSAIPDPHAQAYMFGTDFNGVGPLLNVTDWNPSWAWAAGGLISTLHDLEIWVKALATGQLLSAATQQERLTFVDTGGIWLEKPFGYGLGVIDYAGFVGHSGVIFGSTSWMAHQPETGASIIVLTNLYLAADHLGPAESLGKIIQQTQFS